MINKTIRAGSYVLSTTDKTLIAGVLNVTPDSFSDGGQYFSPEKAIDRALEMADQGADLIDIGGESSRPFAESVSVDEELKRVMPVLEVLVRRLRIPIAIDTSKAPVMREAILAGASLVNDITALTVSPESAEIIREHRTGLVLMHMQGTPGTMQQKPQYEDVVREVKCFLSERLAFALGQGISREQIIIDPGIGFGKTLEHNLVLLNKLQEFTELACPILVGVSRKSFINALLNLPVNERLEGSLAAAVMAVCQGASLVRVHDVRETYRAMAVVDAIKRA